MQLYFNEGSWRPSWTLGGDMKNESLTLHWDLTCEKLQNHLFFVTIIFTESLNITFTFFDLLLPRIVLDFWQLLFFLKGLYRLVA
jgi:hypothetical protein